MILRMARYLVFLSSACVVLLLFLVSLSESAHFRGATIQWSPVYSAGGRFTGSVHITHQISWARNSAEGGHCNSVTIESRTLLGGSTGSLSCQTGCSGDIGNLNYFCTDFSELSNWSTGKRTYDYNASGLQVFEASFASCCWQALATPFGDRGLGFWEVRVKFNLTERADTGRVNTSPTTVFFPDLQKQYGCNHTIQIPVFDVDEDVIRCRWAAGSESECADVCNNLHPAEINSETCTIEFSATGAQGFYVVAIQVEDFATADDTEPLSSVPVQFLLEVVDRGLSCTDRVEFVGDTPAHGACFGVAVNQTLSGTITARDTEGHNITDIQTVSPPGLRKSDLATDEGGRDWYAEFHWTPEPSAVGPQLFCFTAHDSAGASSLQRCIKLEAGASAPTIIEDSVSPRGLINQTDILEWSVQFDTTFVRPSSSVFVRVFTEDREEVVSIDVSLSDSVFYPESEDTPVLRFQTNFTVLEGSTYYVLLGSGVALTPNDTCVTKSLPVDNPTVWTVSVVVSDPCLDSPCDPNADCAQLNPLSPNFTCVCRPGFTGDGFSCIVPDPCMSDPCDVNADCTRQSLLNSLFNCSCRQPFEGSGDTCSIPDPCLSGPCDINATCTREGLLSRRFECSCPEPFTGDGLTCSIPDPCLSDPCHSNASCVREGLRSVEFQCECDPGYQGDGRNCTAILQSDNSRDTIIITVLSIVVVLILVLLVGAVYGYMKVLTQVVRTARNKSDTRTLL